MADLDKEKKDPEQNQKNEPEEPENETEKKHTKTDKGSKKTKSDRAEKDAAAESVAEKDDSVKEDTGPAGDHKAAAETDQSVPADDSLDEESDAEDDYGEEYYYDDFYTESNDDNEDSEPETAPGTDAGGPIIPDDPDDEEEDEQEPKKPKKGQKKVDEKKMPFLDHLEELRWTLMRSLLAIFLGAVISFIFSKQIVDFLRFPGPDDLKLIYLSPTEGFMIYIKVSLFSGLVVAMPYVAYEFWKFVVPGLLEKERKLVPPIVFFTVLCFLIGGSFAYLVIIPFAMNFLLGFQTEYLEATITIGKYLGFVVTLILVFGAVFELPVLSLFLSKIGLLTPEFLRSKRRYGIVTIFIAAALLTPPDIMTQVMLAFPLVALYEISILVSAAVAKQKDKEENEDDD